MSKPNIVFLTTGCANSSITMKMIAALGWNLGNADEQYAEHVEARRINTVAWRGKRFESASAKAMLAKLPAPWAIKDPRFAHTLTSWLPLFVPYRPLLLWVTKDADYSRESIKRRFNGSPETIDQRLKLCRQHFDQWPYLKLHLDAQQIADAVSLFDPSRSMAHR